MKNNLTIKRRLLFINFCVAVCFSLILYVFVKEKNEPIAFARLEKKGNEYQRSLEKLLLGIAQHRILIQHHLLNSKTPEDGVAPLQAAIEASFAEAAQVDKVIGPDLQFTEEGLKQRKREKAKLDLITADWHQLKEHTKSLDLKSSNEAHLSLIEKVRALIAHAGDTSNLILDPDLDSYYLMDVTLLAIPQLQDRIQNTLATLESAIQSGSPTAQERSQALLFATALKESDLDRIVSDIQTSINEDNNFYGKSSGYEEAVSAATKNLQKNVQELIDLTIKISDPKQDLVAREKYAEAAAQALTESYKYWQLCVEKLDDFLQNRIDSHVKKRNWTIAISLALLAALSTIISVVSNSVTQHLLRVINALREESQNLNGESASLREVSLTLSNNSLAAAESLQRSASSLEQIHSMAKRSAENAVASISVAEGSRHATIKGKKTVDEMISAIHDLSKSNGNFVDQLTLSNQRLSEVTKVITEIGEKTKIINDIVFQTKLLSFNASVEAARAGEHGKGFSVVAEEVGGLAQISGNAAREINDLLNRNINAVKSIVEESENAVKTLVQEGQRDIARGLETSQQCQTVLEALSHTQTEVANKVGEISTAVQEQALGVEQINKSVTQLDQSTKQNSLVAQQTNDTVIHITQRLEKLSEGIDSLQSLIN